MVGQPCFLKVLTGPAEVTIHSLVALDEMEFLHAVDFFSIACICSSGSSWS